MSLSLRAAQAADRPFVESLIAREVRAGSVLPRAFDPEAFLVAEEHGAVVGTLSLQAWSDGVIELGTVIAAVPRRGIGRALIAAGLERAAATGARWAVVLTGCPDYFAARGFEPLSDAPWARAQGPVASPDQPEELTAAIGYKAAASCRSCPHLRGCSQALLAHPLKQAWEACA